MIFHRALRLFFFGTKHLDKIDYFGNGNWKIYAGRSMNAYDRLNETDKSIFQFDIRTLDWGYAAAMWTRGGRIHVTKEPFDTIEQTKKHYQLLKRIHYGTMSVFGLIFIYFAIKLFFYLFSLFA